MCSLVLDNTVSGEGFSQFHQTTVQMNFCFYWCYLYITCAVAWDFQLCGMCDQQSLRSALCWSLSYSWSVKLPTEHHLEFLSLKGGCMGASESTLVKMPHCWKSHVVAQMV